MSSISFTTVTWYSKLAAAIFFLLILPIWIFYIGMQYQQTISINSEADRLVTQSAQVTTKDSYDSSLDTKQGTQPSFVDEPFDRSASQACKDADTQGYTLALTECAHDEFTYWDTKLNDVYKKIMTLKAPKPESFLDVGNYVPEVQDSIRKMQRTWPDNRDGQCELEELGYMGGSAAGPAYAECEASLTRERYTLFRSTYENWKSSIEAAL